MATPLRWAFICSPHTGGVWTVYRQLRKGLEPHNIDLRWLCVGQGADSVEVGNLPGFAVAQMESDVATAEWSIHYIQKEQFDGVIINVLTSALEMNLARYLPVQIKRIAITHSITPSTYSAAKGIRDWVHATIGVSPRIVETLIRRYGFSPNSTTCIPNAIQMNAPPFLRKPMDTTIRLLFIGRVIDTDKGVFWLPKILNYLTDVNVTLTVAGDGPDLAELRRRCERFGSRVVFLGQVAGDQIPRLALEHDLLVMPSRFEGFGLSLAEAMAYGCVPVASRIRGTTDYVVRDGKTGLLFSVGNTKAAAQCIRQLAMNRHTLQQMAIAGSEDVQKRFNAIDIGCKYAEVLHKCANVKLAAMPLHTDNWMYPNDFRSGIRRFVPKWIKNWMRRIQA